MHTHAKHERSITLAGRAFAIVKLALRKVPLRQREGSCVEISVSIERSMTNPTTRYGHIEPEHQGKILNVKAAGPGEVEHHGGSFRKYMDNKNKKLQEQFDQQSAVAAAYGAASGHAISDLFRGVSIMVNGFTTPSQAVNIKHSQQPSAIAKHADAALTAIILLCRILSRSWRSMGATLSCTTTEVESPT